MVIIRWIFRTYLRIIYQKNQLGTYIQISNLNINNLKYITSYCNMYKKYINQEKQTDKKIWEILFIVQISSLAAAQKGLGVKIYKKALRVNS